MKKILFLLLAAMLLAGCGKNLTPVEKASVVAEESTETYKVLHKSYKRLEGALTGADLEKLHQAAPYLDKARRHLIAYNNLVIRWMEEGGEKPVDLVANERLLNTLLAEVSAILMDFI